MNRFLWDMRYPGPTMFPGIILWAASARGPVALPGTYRVRLTADGEVRTESFTIAPHPLVTATEADLRARFDLAAAVTTKVSQANEAVIRIRAIKTQIRDRLSNLKDPKRDAKLVTAGEALERSLTAIEGEIYQYRNQSSQDPLNYPIKLNNKLAALLGVVESAEAAPTAAARQVFTELSGRLNQELARLGAAEKELAAFNKLLGARRLKLVEVR